MAAVTICTDFGTPQNKVCHCFHCFPICFPWSDGTGCRDLSFLNIEMSEPYTLPCHVYWLPRILFQPMDRDFLWELQANSPWSYLTVIIMMPQINHLTIVLGYTAPLLYPFSNSELPSVVCTAHTSILLPCNVLYYSGFIFQKFPMVYALPREGNIFLFSNVVKGFKNYLFINLSIIL